MLKSLRKSLCVAVCGVMLMTSPWSAWACTTFRLQAADGTWVIGRSMELGEVLNSQVMLVPRGFDLYSLTPDLKPGQQWSAKYGFLGINTLGRDIPSDGLNEAGLSANALYIPGFFQYQPYPADGKNAISNIDLINWALSQFETVEQVREALPKISVYAIDFDGMGVLALHWAFRDAQGGSIVVEYIDGELNIFDNPIGTLTNAPNFPWHMTNLRNYANLSNINVDGFKLGEVDIKPLGQGSGLMGLPGDFTPPSRFLRATALAYTAKQMPGPLETVNLAFHILNAVDIPIGAVGERVQAHDGKPASIAYEQTQWVTVYDLSNRVAYFRTYQDLNIRMVDLKRVDFTGQKIVHVPMNNTMQVQDLTP